MPRYGPEHSIRISDSIDLLRYQMKRDMFHGASIGTLITLYSLSGTIDPFTEEVSYFQSSTEYPASGILRTIRQGDEFLGMGGRVKVGDTAIVYPYDELSSLLTNNRIVREVKINQPLLSGVYYASPPWIVHLAGEPILIKFALTVDPNG